MYITFDLDGTLCYRNLQVYLQLVNEVLELSIPQERLRSLNQVTLLEQPEAQAAKKRLGDENFRKMVGWSDFDPRSLLERLMYPGAQATVKKVAEKHQVAYSTARACAHDQRKHDAIVQATIQWLTEKDFVNPESCSFCYSISDKLVLLAEHARKTGEHCVLVDDNYRRLLDVYNILDAGVQATLCLSFSLVAFRAKEVPSDCYGLRILPLTRWSTFDQILDVLDKAVVVN